MCTGFPYAASDYANAIFNALAIGKLLHVKNLVRGQLASTALLLTVSTTL
jgi:hypothetical protein